MSESTEYDAIREALEFDAWLDHPDPLTSEDLDAIAACAARAVARFRHATSPGPTTPTDGA